MLALPLSAAPSQDAALTHDDAQLAPVRGLPSRGLIAGRLPGRTPCALRRCPRPVDAAAPSQDGRSAAESRSGTFVRGSPGRGPIAGRRTWSCYWPRLTVCGLPGRSPIAGIHPLEEVVSAAQLSVACSARPHHKYFASTEIASHRSLSAACSATALLQHVPDRVHRHRQVLSAACLVAAPSQRDDQPRQPPALAPVRGLPGRGPIAGWPPGFSTAFFTRLSAAFPAAAPLQDFRSWCPCRENCPRLA